MKYRKLRIAWSVAWGVVCLLVVALWVRSYTYWDMKVGKLGPWHSIAIHSIRGHLFLGIYQGVQIAAISYSFPATSLTETEANGEILSSTGTPQRIVRLQFKWEFEVLGIGLISTSPWRYLAMPYWFLVVSAGGIAALPWFRWRFSVRTLLIGMTVAAIGLGRLVYALRN